MNSIPFDVLMEILPLVSSSDLPALARTNKDLSDHALNRMYSHISSQNVAAACQSVSSNPSLALRVKSLEINRAGRVISIDSILPPLRDALRVTLNLRTLKLDIDGRHSWVLKPALGVFKLRSFSCSAYTDQDLLDFLRDQTELEEIVLSHSYSFIERGSQIPWIFPLLKKFNGPMSWVDLIIPQQPVSHVVISYIRPGSSIASLGLTTAPIRHLQIPLHALEQIHVRELKGMFPVLENLVLTISQVWVIRPVSHIPLPHWLRDLLESLSTVHDLEILGYRPQDEGEHDPTKFVKTATEKAPAVRRFLVQYSKSDGRIAMVNDRTVCWTKGINGWQCIEQPHE
ncbi:hypothetical protein B0H19DRAFT_1120208 [Mycena capillaripes]|nr:hypothetical protein B0H19DRAFT_1120208 [Mycena capillaripes]